MIPDYFTDKDTDIIKRIKMSNTYKILFFSIILWGSISLSVAQKRNYFIIEGKIANVNNGLMRLSYYDLGKWKYDSAFIQSGKYLFHGYVSGPCKAVLSYQNSSKSQYRIDFWLDKVKLQVFSDSISQSRTVIGGTINRDDSLLEYSKRSIKEQYRPLLDTLENLRDRDSISAFREKLYPYLDEIRKTDFSFFASHPNSIITGFYLMPYLSESPLNTLQKIYSRFNHTMRSTIYGNALKKRIEILERVNTGQVAIAFCGTNFFDNTRICLKNFKGKYVLLDFWASWCVPCRQSTPHLINLFNKYMGRGFVVIGIADDDGNLKAWKQAIKKDRSDIWYNILRGTKEGKNGQVDISASINDKYGIQALPTKILIDLDGIIIGRYTGTDEEPALDKKLSEIFE